MTAKASIVKDAVYDVLTVPYDCVTADEDGNSYVNIDQNGEKTQVPVTVGMESDYYVEISGDGIDENTKVYYNTPLINQESNGEAGDMQDGITFDMGGGMQGGGGAPGGGRPSGGGPGGFTMIELHHIIKRFYIGQPNELEILHGIDLKVNKGEFVSIVGSSGSGKTTMMNIIGILDRPTEGEYMLDGVDVAGAKDKELSMIRNQKIGFVFQTYNLISRTSALKNVELPMLYAGVGKKERTERAKELLAMVDMEERMTHNPDELSGGQKQRVAIARAMANDPSIILADEPTGALDSKTGRMIMDIFHRLNEEQGKTIVLITHSQELAEETQRVITLKDGLIIGERRGSGC